MLRVSGFVLVTKLPAQSKTPRSRTCVFLNHCETLRLRSNSILSNPTDPPAFKKTQTLNGLREIMRNCMKKASLLQTSGC